MFALDLLGLAVMAGLIAFLSVVGVSNERRIDAVKERGVAAAVYTDLGTFLERQHALFVRFDSHPSDAGRRAFMQELTATGEIGRRHSAHPFHEIAIREATGAAVRYGDYVQTAVIAMRERLEGSPGAGEAARVVREKYAELRAILGQRRIQAENDATDALVALEGSGNFVRLWAPGIAFAAALLLIAISARSRRALRRTAALQAERALAEEREAVLRDGFERERRAAIEAAEASRMKDNLVATVSHDFRSPLTSIRGYASILRTKRDRLPPEKHDIYLGTIEQQAERLTAMVDGLLMQAGLQREPVFGPDSREAVPLARIAEQVVEEFSLRGTHRVHLDARAEPEVRARRQSIEQVLVNLVDNALKYSPEGSTIWVRVTCSQGQARLCVQDEGPGIAPKNLERIFRSFWRPDGQEQPGTGLGLAIVKGLVESERGRIWAENAPEGGARFTVVFPAHEPATGGADARTA